jgi:hypothetical protein
MISRRGRAVALVALLCVFASAAVAGSAPNAAPPPTHRPGAAPAAKAPVAVIPAARPVAAPRKAVARAGQVVVARAPTPRPIGPRAKAIPAAYAEDLPVHAALDLADDGPDPDHNAVAPGEVTGGTRMGFAPDGLALIGIFGSPGDWRALLRLPSGKVDYVHIGARISDWQVVAISGRQVELTRGLQRRMLNVPTP